MPVIWGLAHPGTGEREVVRALLEKDHDVVPQGQIILGDKGFAGADFEAFITEDLGAHLIRPDCSDESQRFGNLSGIRQWIESVFDTGKGQLTIEQHGGRPWQGFLPGSLRGCSPWPPASGTNGASVHHASAHSSPR